MTLRRILPALLLPAALGLGLPAASGEDAEGGADGRLWEALSGPFRRQADQEPPGHVQVAGKSRQRRMLPSPLVVPLAGSELVGGKGKSSALLNPAAGREALDKASRVLEEGTAGIESADLDALGKELDATEKLLVTSVFSDKDQRAKAQEIAQGIRDLRQRVSIRQDFLRQRIQVTFIIWSPDGKSLAVVSQRILREGDEIVPGLKVSRIDPDEVLFNYRGEEMAVGLP